MQKYIKNCGVEEDNAMSQLPGAIKMWRCVWHNVTHTRNCAPPEAGCGHRDCRVWEPNDRDEEIEFPWYKKGVQSNRLTSHRVKSLPVAEDSQPSKKRKGQPKVSNDHSQKTAGSVKITSADNEGDTDIELDVDRLRQRKLKPWVDRRSYVGQVS